MANAYKDRYGIPGPDVTNLVGRFYKRLQDSDWETADAFVKWGSENGWKSGLPLHRKDKTKPHGPENSFFKTPEMTVRGIAADNRRKKEERKALVSPFCEGCTEKCRVGVGCERWQQYFVKNWDQNISIAKPVPKEDPNVTMCFRYEHPDLVREGIVWTGS